MCYICARVDCTPMFHSAREQALFEPAKIALENYIAVRNKCEDELDALEELDKLNQHRSINNE